MKVNCINVAETIFVSIERIYCINHIRKFRCLDRYVYLAPVQGFIRNHKQTIVFSYSKIQHVMSFFLFYSTRISLFYSLSRFFLIYQSELNECDEIILFPFAHTLEEKNNRLLLSIEHNSKNIERQCRQINTESISPNKRILHF